MNSYLKYFSFCLSKGTSMKKDRGSYALISESPLRIVQVNPSLYGLVDNLAKGESIFHLLKYRSPTERVSATKSILTLVAKGYLSLSLQDDYFNEEIYPEVTVVVPVKNRPDEINACLDSLTKLEYPKEKLEIIVVDDGSVDNTKEVILSYGLELRSFPESRGPSACRNLGAKEAKGEILAFLDSDCTVSPDWLKQIIPYFAFEGVGAVGGFVDSCYQTSNLDRYEASCSPLNMGKRILFETDPNTNFYVPSCNLFVKKEVFQITGGFQEGLHLGEDVDFCWRMRKLGYYLLYVPQGTAAHKHRNELYRMLKRRLEYGTSEAHLHKLHAEKHKKFPFPISGGASFLSLTLAIILKAPIFLAIGLLLMTAGVFEKTHKLAKQNLNGYGFIFLSASTIKSTIALYYYFSFFIVRYYFMLIFFLGLLFAPMELFLGFCLMISCLVDYFVKKPRVSFHVFLILYAFEHIAYQIGVFVGCLKQKSFKCYFLKIKLI